MFLREVKLIPWFDGIIWRQKVFLRLVKLLIQKPYPLQSVKLDLRSDRLSDRVKLLECELFIFIIISEVIKLEGSENIGLLCLDFVS